MERSEILEKAKQCVTGSREQDYGSPENNFKIIAAFWSAYTGCEIKSKDVAAMLALMKIARIKSGNAKADNWVDLAGYAACGGEIEGGYEKDEPKKITNAEKYKEEIEEIGEEDLAVIKATGKPIGCMNNDGLLCVDCLFDCGKKNYSEEVEKWLAQEAK